MIVCVAGATLLLIWTFLYQKLFGTPVCSVRWVIVLKVTGFFMFLWATVVGFVQLENGKREEELVNTDILLLVGWGVLIFIAMIIGYKRKWEDRRKLHQTLASSTMYIAIQDLIQQETQVSHEGGVLRHWHSINNNWVRTMNNHKHRPVMLAKRPWSSRVTFGTLFSNKNFSKFANNG
eukprot:TRINITY_DN7090_c0_g2_i1.p1 TRINITY_DN7090_c0_g2~~TRINITY_DN7090_c0_g2_i1.p1  ORF type:complete len:178 (-),score=13.53 TRINITY_DN7090_c0_g2_i1:53-586(-)